MLCRCSCSSAYENRVVLCSCILVDYKTPTSSVRSSHTRAGCVCVFVWGGGGAPAISSAGCAEMGRVFLFAESVGQA
jgi:hypothetical protein